MPEAEALRALIVERLASGLLPWVDCQMTWWGPGKGRACAACGLPIVATDIECECDLPDGTTIRFHRWCFDVWDGERLNRPN
jgi:hypothetical protein